MGDAKRRLLQSVMGLEEPSTRPQAVRVRLVPVRFEGVEGLEACRRCGRTPKFIMPEVSAVLGRGEDVQVGCPCGQQLMLRRALVETASSVPASEAKG